METTKHLTNVSPYSEELQKLFVELYKNDVAPKKIATMFGLSTTNPIYKALRRHNVTYRQLPNITKALKERNADKELIVEPVVEENAPYIGNSLSFGDYLQELNDITMEYAVKLDDLNKKYHLYK